MKWIPKVLALTLLWGVVGYLTGYVPPEKVKDVGIAGLYLPYVMGVVTAFWYTSLVISRSWGYASLLSALVMTGMVLTILRWMNGMVLLALVGMASVATLTFIRRS